MDKFLIFIMACMTLCSCTPKTEDEKIREQIRYAIPEAHKYIENDCVLVAVNIHFAIESNKILQGCNWKKILFFTYTMDNNPDKILGHAALVFLYPPNTGKSFIADENGTRKFIGYVGDPLSIAKAGYPKSSGYNVIKAEYVTEN